MFRVFLSSVCINIQCSGAMDFHRWHNMVYSSRDERASFDVVGIVTGAGTEYSHWLGTVDQRIALCLPIGKGLLLDIESWRCMILQVSPERPTIMQVVRLPGVHAGGEP